MLICGLLCFAMPLAAIAYTGFAGSALVGAAASEGAKAGAVVGTAIGGAALTAVSGVIGFFLGAIFLTGSYFTLRKS